MRPLPTPEEMRRFDDAAIAAGTPAEVLMERAGRAVAAAVLRVAGRRYGLRIVLVCGKGNNGGDGFVAARALWEQGVHATCLLLASPEEFAGAARHHLDALRAAGGPFRGFSVDAVAGDVVVDAIFGTGFRGEVEGEARAAIEAINKSRARVVAVDIPSGVDGTTGRVSSAAVHADVTVCMGAEKSGTATGTGAAHAGRIVVADIGIPVEDTRIALVEAKDVRAWLPRRPDDAHKGSAGSVTVLAGSGSVAGAPMLSCLGAFRAGAGYVRLCTVDAIAHAAAIVPEVLLHTVPEEVLGPGALDRFADVIQRSDVVAVGPGLGTGDEQRDLVHRLLEETDKMLVLDADALNVLAGEPDRLAKRDAPIILTPHPAELGRLLGSDASEVQSDRVGAALEAAERFGCVVVLKGHRTLIAAPEDGAIRILVDPAGGPELASAGTGDVLTGITAAFAAALGDPVTAAATATYVHGLAGSIAAGRLGPLGVMAHDVAGCVPQAIARLTSAPT